MQSQPASDVFLKDAYPALYGKAKRTIAKPGDRIPIAGLDWRIVTSAGEAIKTPLPGAGQPNPYCAAYKPQDVDTTENAQSVGSVVTFGRFRAVHLGDLTWNKEFDLMCPTNRIGTVDVFFVSHHGQPISNAEVLVHALQSRVAIMNNGTRKGGQPPAMRIIHSAPRLEDLWQVHFSTLERPGTHRARPVHRQHDRRSAGRDAGGADRPAATRPRRAAAAGAQRPGLLDQGLGAAGWLVHRHQPAQRLQQGVQGELTTRRVARRSVSRSERPTEPMQIT